MTQRLFAFVFSVSLFLPAGTALAGAPQALLDKAGALYDKGDCEAASGAYQRVRSSGTASKDELDLAGFRIGYCAYSLGDYENAIVEFRAIVSRHPDEDEARLRLAEALYATESFEESAATALAVKDKDLVVAARIVAAQSLIEMQQAQKALATLREVSTKDPATDSIVDFWRGLAYFQLFDERGAEVALKRAMRTANDGLWTKTAAENWLKTVADSKRWIHARAGLSRGFDTNLSQVTYRDSRTSSADSKYYTWDTYNAVDLSVSTKALRSDRVLFVPSISGSALAYSNSGNKSYNPTIFGANLTTTYSASYRWTHRSALSYSTALYNNTRYLDYASATYSAIYGLSKSSTLYAGAGVTAGIGDYPSTTYAPSIGAEGNLYPLYWLVNLSYSLAQGNKAKYTTVSNSTSVTSGSTFSNYDTQTLRAGLGSVLPGDLDLLGQVVLTNTSYGDESVPSTAAYSTDKRKDSSWSLQATLSRSIIERRMTIAANVSYFKQTSSGYQGLSYTTGASPDYNFSRTQGSVYLSYGF